MATLTPSFAELLPGWIARQRWYARTGSTPRFTHVGGLRYQDPAGEVGIQTWFLRDDSNPRPTIYQVPLTYRGAPVAGLEHALVARAGHSELGERWIYDGCHDPVGAEAILDTILSEATVVSDGAEGTGLARGALSDTAGDLPRVRRRGASPGGLRVLSGEQSNTSIIVDPAHSPLGIPLIVKVFRVLHDGLNPDVELQQVLASAGSSRVPRPIGALEGTWATSPTPGPADAAHGHLAVAQEFLPEVEDAWRVAVRAASDDVDFTGRARELGVATAEVHELLASSLGTENADPGTRASLAAAWRARAEDAVRAEPTLAARSPEIEAVFTAAERAAWPALQRIHGDYHLGQVLDVAGRGWVLLDFEGEPLRPLAERTAPDLALRDVAGMLRSWDYAAGAAGVTGRTPWAARAREAFLDGYGERGGRDPRSDAALLDALELDKALYEVVYEAGNRPDWLHLPLAGLTSLLRNAASPS